jgi:hypothetical protein
MLLTLHGDLDRAGGGLVLAHPTERLRSTLAAMHVATVLPTVATVSDGVRLLSEGTSR